MRTIMFKRDKLCHVADIILTVLEPLDDKHQVVFFCQDKSGNKYRVPKSEVIMTSDIKPKSKINGKKKSKKKRKCCA